MAPITVEWAFDNDYLLADKVAIYSVIHIDFFGAGLLGGVGNGGVLKRNFLHV
jgi:hypothetical protein